MSDSGAADGGPGGSDLVLPDAAALADLQTFVGRARQIDAGGAVRLVAAGPVLAVYASALHGSGGPTVLGLRVLALAEPATVDVTVPMAALADRFALIDRARGDRRPGPGDQAALSGSPPAQVRLPVPPAPAVTTATWAGMVPPRTGWSVEGMLRAGDLRAAARAGIDEVAAGTPEVAGAAAVGRLRARVWGRPLPAHDQLPAGTAFALEAFGFLGDDDVISLHRAGRWWRLSTTRGHVLARAGLGLG